MAIDFTTAAEAQAQQNNAGANAETAPITQEYMLTQINNSIKVRVAGGSSYADFNFSIFKSGKYTDLLLYYAGLVQETNKQEPLPATTAQKYAGIPTNNPINGETYNWWYKNISQYLTDKGYKWTFLYYRNNELPFGFRVSWSTDTSNTSTNPIWAAQNIDFPYLILPENCFILQKADKVEIAETLPAGQEATSDKIKSLLTVINNKISAAAQSGMDGVLIPWTAFGGSSLDAQLSFIQLKADVVAPSSNADAAAAVVDYLGTHNLFEYGNFSTNYYPSVKYRVYNIDEIKTSKDGVAPIAIFTSSNVNGEYYTFNPSADADEDKVKDFTLYTLLANVAGYSVACYADLSDGEPYCAGIALGWGSGNASEAAATYYLNKKNAYDTAQLNVYHFEDIPVDTDYTTQDKSVNSSYLSKIIQITGDKMRGAFEKAEREIIVLWTDIDSKNPSTVYLKWASSGALEFDGAFSTSLHTTAISSCSAGLKSAFNTLLAGYNINDSAISTSVLGSSTKKAHYLWTYIAYKDAEFAASTSNRVSQPTDLSKSRGIAIYLGKEKVDNNFVTNAAQRLQKLVDEQGKKDPSKK